MMVLLISVRTDQYGQSATINVKYTSQGNKTIQTHNEQNFMSN